MRILGKRTLQTVTGQQTRPTTARVREAIFNIWQFELSDCRWLDVCAGTGSMGAEALLRGAAFVGGIEQSRQACRTITQNWQKLVEPHQSIRVWRGDVLRVLPNLAGQTFDYIYFDPPYDSSLYSPVLEAIATHHLLTPTGWLAVEHRARHILSQSCGELHATQTRTYGSTAITFYQVQKETSFEHR
jgi:16S rRNA (guanine(966)-N(2))-methyltransferase RsmD